MITQFTQEHLTLLGKYKYALLELSRRGHEIARLQLRVHRQRIANKEMKLHLTQVEDREMALMVRLRQALSHVDQNQKLIESNRKLRERLFELEALRSTIDGEQSSQ